MDLSLLAPYLLACLAIELTPGPNMTYLALLSAERGRRAGMFAVAGVALGLSVLAILAVLGVGAVIARNALLYEIVRWAGIGFLVYLAYDAWADARRPPEILPPTRAALRYFGRGLIANLLNPKAILFYLTVMPSFIAPDRPALMQAVGLATLYVLVATGSHVGVVVLAGTAQPLLADPAVRKRMAWVFAIMLLGVAGWLAVSTAR
jgi:threonine/homoserine/homoserine lactone efflux protein